MNVNKKSVGLSIGTKGARVSVNSRGRTTTTVGIPGSGLSYSHTSQKRRNKKSSPTYKQALQRVSRIITLEKDGQIKYAAKGFSWATLFFGAATALLRRDFKWFTIILVISIVMGFFANLIGIYAVNLVFGFIYNKLYLNDLLKNGWIQRGAELNP